MGCINAEFFSADWKEYAEFDAEPYFLQASDDELKALVACDFAEETPADRVAIFCRNLDSDLDRVFKYAEERTQHFYVYIFAHVAKRWIEEHKPHLLTETA